MLFLPPICAYPALVIKPIIDLVGAPLESLCTNSSVQKMYSHLSLATIKDCGHQQRLHQLLFNEIVDVLEEKNSQVKIKVPYLFYCTKINSQPQDIYWTQKKWLVPLKNLAIQLVNHTLPEPINYMQTEKNKTDATHALLVEPYYDKGLHKTLSFGTRFVVHSHDNRGVKVWRYNPITHINEQLILPYNSVLIQKKQPTIDTAISTFITLARRCTEQLEGVVAYVWGGCSFTHRIAQNFITQTKKYHNCAHSFYARSNDTTPKNGFDCSGLITRTAQMAGIPYFFKNTFTAQAYLQEIGSKNPEVGDLIWIPGHIMIISDIEKQLLIEARGYQHGYGIVQEIPLNKVFKNIATFTDLQNAIHNKKPVVRLDSLGQERDWYSDIKILSLKSCWRN